MSIFRIFNRFPSTGAASSVIPLEEESQESKVLEITKLCQNSNGEIFIKIFKYELESTRSFPQPISKELSEFLLQEHELSSLSKGESVEGNTTEIPKGIDAKEEDKVIHKDDTKSEPKTKENTKDVAKKHTCQKDDKEEEGEEEEEEKDDMNDMKETSKEPGGFFHQQQMQTPLTSPAMTKGITVETSKEMLAKKEDKVVGNDNTRIRATSKGKNVDHVAKGNITQNVNKEKKQEHRSDNVMWRRISEFFYQQREVPISRPASNVEPLKISTRTEETKTIDNVKLRNKEAKGNICQKVDKEFFPQQQRKVPLSRPASNVGSRVEPSKVSTGEEETKATNKVELRNKEAKGNVCQKVDKEKEKGHKSDTSQKRSKEKEKDNKNTSFQREDKKKENGPKRDIYVNGNKNEEKDRKSDTCQKDDKEKNSRSDIKESKVNKKSPNMISKEKGIRNSIKQMSESESTKISHEESRPGNSENDMTSEAPPLPTSEETPPKNASRVIATPKNWQPRSESATPCVHERPICVEKDPEGRFKSLLNKLSPRNFETVSEQICAHLDENPFALKGAVDLICSFARFQQFYSRTYAALCYMLSHKLTGGKGLDFKNDLIFHCLELFEGRRVLAASRKSRRSRPKNKGEIENELETIKDRKDYVALCAFLANLVLEGILPTRTLIGYLQDLMMDRKDDTAIESLCALLRIAGRKMEDNVKTSQKETKKLSNVYNNIREIVDKKLVSNRLRYFLVDVLELRERGWQPRTQKQVPR